MKAATPAKLRNGSWGARVASTSVEVNDAIQVTTRAGKTWTAYVAQVVWAGKDATLVATCRAPVAPYTPPARKCSECGGELERSNPTRYCDPCAESLIEAERARIEASPAFRRQQKGAVR